MSELDDDNIDYDSLFESYKESAISFFNCSEETAKMYASYKLDGYNTYQARQMSGLIDPPDEDACPDETYIESKWENRFENK